MEVKYVKPKWRKVLYINQGVADNYVDDSFLEEMRKNVDVKLYTLPTVIFESLAVVQQFSSICIFLATFLSVENQSISPVDLLFYSATVSVSSCLLLLTLKLSNGQLKLSFQLLTEALDNGKGIIIFSLFTYCFSPVLATLSRTISTDTIYAMTVASLLVNLFLHDYGADAAIVSKYMSLNASVFASVCLASRLETWLHAYAMVMFSMVLFAVLPYIRFQIKIISISFFILMTLLISITTIIHLSKFSMLSVILFIMVIFCVTFIFPYYLVKLQRYKNTIHGPWDEAVVND